MRLLVVIVGFLLCLSSVRANVIDSLETELEKTTDADRRLSLISEMIRHTLFSQVDESEQYVRRFQKEAAAAGKWTRSWSWWRWTWTRRRRRWRRERPEVP